MSLMIKPYSREAACLYAKEWALKRNPLYYDFENLGGDCTNFASQCLYAGSGVMNYTKTFGWYYINAANRAPSWTGVEFLYNFIIGNQAVGPFGQDIPLELIEPGDIIQIATERPDFHHTPVVLSVGDKPSPNNIMLAAHSYDAINKPLSAYNYHKIRIIHIIGVRQTERI